METNQEEQKQEKKTANPLNSYAKYSTIVIQMVVIIGVGTYAGIKLDEHYSDGGNTWTLVLSLASVCIALYFVIRRILAPSKYD
ncbi:Putative F0F1-ATPase subunit Ca2+/Mg2+ transporter [Flavobacteriaceae bacterium MAR_2010_188]|nr:Putative F0F1-ATPase subunit Ca2+/Mg2+ transporter [Flavobacteriaceae bacterium MAR_2010_188]